MPNRLTRSLLIGLIAGFGAGTLAAAETDTAVLLANLDRELAALAAADPASPVAQKGRAAADAAEIPASGPAGAAVLELPTTGGGDPNAELDGIISGLGLEAGFQERHGQVLIVAKGFAQVHGAPGSAAWANARGIAYATAELRARAALIQALGETVLSGRSVTALEDAGAITDPTAPKPLDRAQIGTKAQTTAEAQLDAELAKLGVPPERYRDLPPEKKRLLLSEAYESYVKVAAARALSGVATLAVTEGPSEGNQGVAVALVWSEQLAKLSTLFARYGGLLPPKAPVVGKRLADQIPTDPNRLLRCFGVQRCVDETGETVLVAFAQSGLADVAPAMRATALANAYDKAGLEARAQLKSFVYEQTSTEAQRELSQLAAVTVGERSQVQEVTVQQAERYQRGIRSGGEQKIALTGVTEAKRWNGRIDGTPVAGVVLTWSPRNQRLAAQASAANAQAAAAQPGAPAQPTGAAGSSGASTTFDPTK